MKKRTGFLPFTRLSVIAVIIAVFAALLPATSVLACDISISPAQASGQVGDKLTFTVTVVETHRNCTTPIGETQITLKGMRLVTETPWQAVSSTTNTKKVTVEFQAAGSGSITVSRECSKGGDTSTIKVDIKGAAATSLPATAPPPSTASLPALTSNPPPSSPPAQVTPALTPLPAPSASPSATPPETHKTAEADTGWWQAFTGAVSQPSIIAHILLLSIATLGFMRRFRRWRFPILIGSLAYLGFITGGCLCALGAMQNLVLRSASIKTYLFQYILLGIPLVTTLLFGRVFCGWVCPMGAVQQLIYRKDIALKLHPRLAKSLRYGKYLALAALVVTVLFTRTTIFSSIDPFKSLFNIEVTPVATSILAVVLLASIFIFAPWCRFLCPLGAFLSIFAYFSIFKLKANSSCKNCKACRNLYCDYKAIDEVDGKQVVNSLECTRCGECRSRCPSGSFTYSK